MTLLPRPDFPEQLRPLWEVASDPSSTVDAFRSELTKHDASLVKKWSGVVVSAIPLKEDLSDRTIKNACLTQAMYRDDPQHFSVVAATFPDSKYEVPQGQFRHMKDDEALKVLRFMLDNDLLAPANSLLCTACQLGWPKCAAMLHAQHPTPFNPNAWSSKALGNGGATASLLIDTVKPNLEDLLGFRGAFVQTPEAMHIVDSAILSLASEPEQAERLFEALDKGQNLRPFTQAMATGLCSQAPHTALAWMDSVYDHAGPSAPHHVASAHHLMTEVLSAYLNRCLEQATWDDDTVHELIGPASGPRFQALQSQMTAWIEEDPPNGTMDSSDPWFRTQQGRLARTAARAHCHPVLELFNEAYETACPDAKPFITWCVAKDSVKPEHVSDHHLSETIAWFDRQGVAINALEDQDDGMPKALAHALALGPIAGVQRTLPVLLSLGLDPDTADEDGWTPRRWLEEFSDAESKHKSELWSTVCKAYNARIAANDLLTLLQAPGAR